MRFALAFLLVAGLAAPTASLAQTEDQYRIVDPFRDQEPRGGVSARISDGEEPPERESGFSFPKLSMPKLPKFSMPKWKMPQLPGASRREADAPRTRQTSRMTGTRSTSNRNTPPAGPSAWEKFNNGRKSFFAKTKSTLMPWTKDTAEAAPAGIPTGSNRVRVASNRSRQEEEQKPNLFSPFLPDKKPEEKRVNSTTDFLSLPRPKLD